MPSSKQAALSELVELRRGTPWPSYKGIEDYDYQCDHVSPVTKSAGNVDADIFILLQDWSSDESLGRGLDQETRDLGYTPTEATFKTLIVLLRKHLGAGLEETYATNLFPFIKSGEMTNRIPVRDLNRAAKDFAIPQIEIVEPLLVICLGVPTFNALRRVRKERLVANIDAALTKPFWIGDSEVWCQAHTGARGRNSRNAGDAEHVQRDWRAMAKQFAQGSAGLRPGAAARRQSMAARITSLWPAAR